MSTIMFLGGIITGASFMSLWALGVHLKTHEQHLAKLEDARRRAWADGYDQGHFDGQHRSGLKARSISTTV